MKVEKFIEIERSQRRALFIAVAAIAVFGLYRWILTPHTNQLFAAQRYSSSLDAAIHKADFMSTMMEKKKTKIGELAQQSNNLRNQLFTQNEARRFIGSLPSFAAQSGCVIVSVSNVANVRQDKQEEAPAVLPKKSLVTIAGGFNGIVTFISVLQNYERKVWIDSVKIDGSAGKLKCQAILTVYCIDNAENN